jgi:hypothetical protein
MNGDDLNSDPDQNPTRWAINFWDWPGERASKYKAPWQWLEEHVRPYRQRLKEDGSYVMPSPLPEKWWLYWRNKSPLFHLLGLGYKFEAHPRGWSSDSPTLDRLIVYATAASKYATFSFKSGSIIYSHAVGLISNNSSQMLAELSSSFHTHWAFKYGSRLGTTLRYAPTDCYENFPFINSSSDLLIELGEKLSDLRANLMKVMNFGSTQLYNEFNNENNQTNEINDLRLIHKSIDIEIARQYGWVDINLAHGYHLVDYLPSGDRIRYTISEESRLEVIRRLVELNRIRYIEDQSEAKRLNYHSKPKSKKARSTKTTQSASFQAPFDFGG